MRRDIFNTLYYRENSMFALACTVLFSDTWGKHFSLAWCSTYEHQKKYSWLTFPMFSFPPCSREEMLELEQLEQSNAGPVWGKQKKKMEINVGFLFWWCSGLIDILWSIWWLIKNSPVWTHGTCLYYHYDFNLTVLRVCRYGALQKPAYYFEVFQNTVLDSTGPLTSIVIYWMMKTS